ncbi:radical SAM protein, partial [Candidatus Bathyarchaeota archaeon]|nr:radical SAM protein [Candidatus Bathyarchaeota archaeon]
RQRPELPLLTATTLLVPGYVDVLEVEKIAIFLADLDRKIPYSLLVFHPDFMMSDLPVTPYRQVQDCYRAAKKHLASVNIGNLATLGIRSWNV